MYNNAYFYFFLRLLTYMESVRYYQSLRESENFWQIQFACEKIPVFFINNYIAPCWFLKEKTTLEHEDINFHKKISILTNDSCILFVFSNRSCFFIRTEIMWNKQAQSKHRTPLSLIGSFEGNKFIDTWWYYHEYWRAAMLLVYWLFLISGELL